MKNNYNSDKREIVKAVKVRSNRFLYIRNKLSNYKSSLKIPEEKSVQLKNHNSVKPLIHLVLNKAHMTYNIKVQIKVELSIVVELQNIEEAHKQRASLAKKKPMAKVRVKCKLKLKSLINKLTRLVELSIVELDQKWNKKLKQNTKKLNK